MRLGRQLVAYYSRRGQNFVGGGLLATIAGTRDWQAGMRFSSSASEAEVAEWANSLGRWAAEE